MNLTPDDLRIALYLVSGLLDRRRMRYEPIPKSLVDCHRRLAAAHQAAMAARGHENNAGTSESDGDDRIGTAQAAEIMGKSSRQVRRIATDLDGRKVGRDWTFPRATVESYSEGRQHH